MSQQINLFNPIFLKKKKQFSALAMLQGLGLVMIGMMILMGYSKWRIGKDMAEAARIAARLKTMQVDLVAAVEKGKLPATDKALEAELQKLEAQLQSNRQLLGYAGNGASGRALRYTDYFRAFSHQAMPGVWLTGFALSEGAADIEISGRALRPDLFPAYIRALHQEDALRGRAFSSMELEHKEAAADQRAAPAAAAPEARMESLLRSLSPPAAAAEPARKPPPPAGPAGAKSVRSWFEFTLSSDEAQAKAGAGNGATSGTGAANPAALGNNPGGLR